LAEIIDWQRAVHAKHYGRYLANRLWLPAQIAKVLHRKRQEESCASLQNLNQGQFTAAKME
jgi:hypothetical protein